eukprot:jgi/Ulvmu1/1900/UM012_0059.1
MQGCLATWAVETPSLTRQSLTEIRLASGCAAASQDLKIIVVDRSRYVQLVQCCNMLQHDRASDMHVSHRVFAPLSPVRAHCAHFESRQRSVDIVKLAADAEAFRKSEPC